MMSVSPEAVESWQEIATEWGRFVTDRLQRDMETQRAMLDCRSPSELLKVQTEFYQTAIQQYSEETMRLMQMMSEAAGKSMSGMKTARKYDDVPL
jgi:hypothetical protein